MKPDSQNLLALEAKDARIKELEEANLRLRDALNGSTEAIFHAVETMHTAANLNQGVSEYHHQQVEAWLKARNEALGKDHS